MGTKKGFTGQYEDATTGLDYYNARYYDPVVGRFVSADREEGNGQRLDPYAYVQGNPETWSDPTGQMAVGGAILAGAAAAAGGISAGAVLTAAAVVVASVAVVFVVAAIVVEANREFQQTVENAIQQVKAQAEQAAATPAIGSAISAAGGVQGKHVSPVAANGKVSGVRGIEAHPPYNPTGSPWAPTVTGDGGSQEGQQAKSEQAVPTSGTQASSGGDNCGEPTLYRGGTKSKSTINKVRIPEKKPRCFS